MPKDDHNLGRNHRGPPELQKIKFDHTQMGLKFAKSTEMSFLKLFKSLQ